MNIHILRKDLLIASSSGSIIISEYLMQYFAGKNYNFLGNNTEKWNENKSYLAVDGFPCIEAAFAIFSIVYVNNFDPPNLCSCQHTIGKRSQSQPT